jgi:hypothetical protein
MSEEFDIQLRQPGEGRSRTLHLGNLKTIAAYISLSHRHEWEVRCHEEQGGTYK